MTPDLERGCARLCWAGFNERESRDDTPDEYWSKLPEGVRECYRNELRAALQALRSPSPELREAYIRAFEKGPDDDWIASLDMAWQAAIDRICE